MYLIAIRTVGISAIAIFCTIFGLLGGCALPSPPQRFQGYDFGGAADVVVANPALADPSTGARRLLLLRTPQSQAGLDGSAMLYRLAYTNAQQLRAYAQARWSLPPTQLLQQRLQPVLQNHFLLVGAADLLGSRSAALELRIELEEFSQVFEQPDASHAVLQLRASLIERGGTEPRGLLAQRSFHLQATAPSPDAAGGAAALRTASDAAAQELLNWLRWLP